jgi:hypothetical protein
MSSKIIFFACVFVCILGLAVAGIFLVPAVDVSTPGAPVVHEEAAPTPQPARINQPVELTEENLSRIHAAKERLYAEHKISLTTGEIRIYVKENIAVKPWHYDSQQEFGRKLLAAHEEVILQNADPQAVAKRYTENFSDFRFWFATLSKAKKDDLDAIRSHLYDSYEDMIEKNLPEWRDTAMQHALAEKVLPASQSDSTQWKEFLYRYLLEYPQGTLKTSGQAPSN